MITMRLFGAYPVHMDRAFDRPTTYDRFGQQLPFAASSMNGQGYSQYDT
jgi:hypothetical protein